MIPSTVTPPRVIPPSRFPIYGSAQPWKDDHQAFYDALVKEERKRLYMQRIYPKYDDPALQGHVKKLHQVATQTASHLLSFELQKQREGLPILPSYHHEELTVVPASKRLNGQKFLVAGSGFAGWLTAIYMLSAGAHVVVYRKYGTDTDKRAKDFVGIQGIGILDIHIWPALAFFTKVKFAEQLHYFHDALASELRSGYKQPIDTSRKTYAYLEQCLERTAKTHFLPSQQLQIKDGALRKAGLATYKGYTIVCADGGYVDGLSAEWVRQGCIDKLRFWARLWPIRLDDHFCVVFRFGFRHVASVKEPSWHTAWVKRSLGKQILLSMVRSETINKFEPVSDLNGMKHPKSEFIEIALSMSQLQSLSKDQFRTLLNWIRGAYPSDGSEDGVERHCVSFQDMASQLLASPAKSAFSIIYERIKTEWRSISLAMPSDVVSVLEIESTVMIKDEPCRTHMKHGEQDVFFVGKAAHDLPLPQCINEAGELFEKITQHHALGPNQNFTFNLYKPKPEAEVSPFHLNKGWNQGQLEPYAKSFQEALRSKELGKVARQLKHEATMAINAALLLTPEPALISEVKQTDVWHKALDGILQRNSPGLTMLKAAWTRSTGHAFKKSSVGDQDDIREAAALGHVVYNTLTAEDLLIAAAASKARVQPKHQ